MTGGRGQPVNGHVSHWNSSLGTPPRRHPLLSDADADVCIVGAGFTGLWTAYYLARAAPRLRIVVLEAEFAGFGASGRNGGWLSADLPGSRRRYAAAHGRASVFAFQHALEQTVDEVETVTANEGIDAELRHGGVLRVACSPSQAARLTSQAATEQSWGVAELRILGPDEVARRVAIPDVRAASFTPRGARIQPSLLARGLARAAERRGVRICESTPVREIGPGVVRTDGGDVRAEYVLRATEGFTGHLPGQRRQWLPMNSSMIVTEPLDATTWERIGWDGHEVIGDAAHVFMYAQRTADGRIALGGRGSPYRYGSRTDPGGHTPQRTVDGLRAVLDRRFPAAAGAAIEHAWSGALAVPRDWCASVWLDRESGVGGAGGYSGHGVAASNLAGRTLRDLVLGADTELTRLPWVGHRSRRWEPEPLRWLGVHGIYAAYRFADRHERRRTSILARAADTLSGRT
ncbi:MAG: hypothetical protein QOJ50_895 [Cryptosporangiaceae bacterium]|nr:hypothetical protein [Cryptosporangiaceae bacterium]